MTIDIKCEAEGLKKDGAVIIEIREKNYFEEWCQMTGWHGILNFYLTKHVFWKSVWLFLVLGGCFLAINQSVSMILDFNSSDQWVASVLYELPKEGRLKWPNITICGLDWVSELKSAHDEDFEATGLGVLKELANGSNSSGTKVEPILSTKPESTSLCSETVVGCGYTRMALAGAAEKDCCGRQEQDEYSNQKCFRLNPDETFRSKNKKRTKAEARIYYLLKGASSGTESDMTGAGYRVGLYLGDSNTEDEFRSEFYITPGTRNLFSLTMEKHRTVIRGRAIRFYNPRKPCGKRYAFLKQSKYTKELCAADCAIQYQLRICKCVASATWSQFVNKKLVNVPKCRETAEEQCLDSYNEARKTLELGLAPGKKTENLTLAMCEDECPEPCDYAVVQAKLSSAALFPSSKVDESLDFLHRLYSTQDNYDPAKSAINTRNAEELEQLTMLELYYESKQIKVMERVQRLSIDELISNIGGTLGVWSGLSLLSILQMFVYMLRALIHYIFARRVQRCGKKLGALCI